MIVVVVRGGGGEDGGYDDDGENDEAIPVVKIMVRMTVIGSVSSTLYILMCFFFPMTLKSWYQ